MDGEKSSVHCPLCDELLWWWGFASSYTGDGSSELGMGCENEEGEVYEVLPEDVYDAIVTEEERLYG